MRTVHSIFNTNTICLPNSRWSMFSEEANVTISYCYHSSVMHCKGNRPNVTVIGIIRILRLWPVVDPEFPRWGLPTPEFGVKTYYLGKIFAKNCIKMKEIGPTGVGGFGNAPLDPPMVTWYVIWLFCSVFFWLLTWKSYLIDWIYEVCLHFHQNVLRTGDLQKSVRWHQCSQ